MKILAIDPGKASGFALSEVDDETGEWKLLQVFVTHDGVSGVADAFWNGELYLGDVTVVERFIVRPNQPVDPVALEVIGFIKGTHPRPATIEWRLRSDKKHIPDAMLKQHGLWHTGKQVGHEDGRDVNDAIIHTLSWLCFKARHKPTIEWLFPDE
jgi:hypothetical protein